MTRLLADEDEVLTMTQPNIHRSTRTLTEREVAELERDKQALRQAREVIAYAAVEAAAQGERITAPLRFLVEQYERERAAYHRRWDPVLGQAPR